MGSIPETVNTPCCFLLRTHISHSSRDLLIRVINVARSFYGWRCKIFAFPPEWHLYIAKEDLTEQQVIVVKQRRGPVLVLNQILKKLISANK